MDDTALDHDPMSAVSQQAAATVFLPAEGACAIGRFSCSHTHIATDTARDKVPGKFEDILAGCKSSIGRFLLAQSVFVDPLNVQSL